MIIIEQLSMTYGQGLALGWLFSSSVFVNNSVKVVANAFDFAKNEREEERHVCQLLSKTRSIERCNS
jgi:hypothetical protein